MNNTNSLFRYLLTRILLLVVPLVVAGMALIWFLERRLLQVQFDETLVEKARTLATLVTHEEGKVELEFADEFMPEYSRVKHPYFFQIWTPDGRSLERSYSLHGEDLPFRFGSLDAPAAFETALASGARLRCIGIKFPARLGPDSADLPAASAVIVLGAGTAQLAGTLRKGYVQVAITGLVSVGGISIFVVLALRRGVHLLESVVGEVEGIHPGTLDDPLDEERAPREIRPIVVTLNRSLQRIRGFVERERRFTADVAHELRTPIAELRAAADIALHWPDDESHRRLAEDARAIALQMGGLVESLLELATIESDAWQGQAEEVDLSKLAHLAVEHASRSRNESRQIRLDAPPALLMASRASLWELALSNLLDNALSHSPSGAPVEVVLRAEADGALVIVSNPTEGLDSAAVERCTERLWRGNRQQGDSRHFGLGLSIVQAACAKLDHGFSVRLQQGVFHATISRTGPADSMQPGSVR